MNYKIFATCTMTSLAALLFHAGDAEAMAYQQGNFSIKPLNVNIINVVFDNTNSSSLFDGSDIDAFKETTVGFGLSDTSRNGISYGIELGYNLTPSTELFATAGYIHEQGNLDDFSFVRQFKYDSRDNVTFSVGARHYFEINHAHWVPFFGGSVGMTHQGETTATLLDNGIPFVPHSSTPAGNFTLSDSQNLLNGMLEVGADYRFNERWAISFKTGVSYAEQGEEQISTIAGTTYSYEDNYDEVSVPFITSLKITF